MTKQEAIKVLIHYNKWRRSDVDLPMPEPNLVGKAIDYAIKKLEKKP